jgi:thiamine-phosphate pyrophosphorylase
MNHAKDIFLGTLSRIYCFADTVQMCRQLLAGGARVIQFRHKTANKDLFLRLAVEMLACVRNYNDAVLIINDRVDIALEVGADGIHVGQEDMDFRQVLKWVPGSMIVGVSARYPHEALAAAAAGATYVGAGAVFSTPTKPEAVVIGLQGLQAVTAAVDIPVVAIGGITIESVRPVLKTGVRFCGVISGINDTPDPAAALRRFIAMSASFPIGHQR